MRTLSVNHMDFHLQDDDAARLVTLGILYPCSDESHGHDLHINPEHEFDVFSSAGDSVELLLSAIFNGRVRSAPTLEDIGVETVTLSGEIEAATAKTYDGEGVLERRIGYIQRNLALNIATTALNNGLFEKVVQKRDDGGVDVRVTATFIPPKFRTNFAWNAKHWVMSQLARLTKVSDQRKDDAIALVRDA